MRRSARLFLLAQLLYALELALLGHWLGAPMALAVTAVSVRFSRGAGRAASTPRRLLLAADGRWHLLTVSGGLEELALQPASLRLGRWLLLLFRSSGGGKHRLLLGPDNLDPALLAALQRRLGFADSGPATTAIGGR